MCRETTLEQVEARLEALRIELAETRGRLTNSPSTFQVLSWFAGIAVALIGVTFTIARVM
ncbi:MAG: hypothetical protein K0S54_3153 [Alphaproteobacteria bacterium]|jgi:hypothetical protein|nr:hypothetical protein [Alphaproteobacteria bacterium]